MPKVDFEAELLAVAGEADMAAMESYVKRERVYELEDADRLRKLWISAALLWCSDPRDPSYQQPFNDLSAEFTLRNELPPMSDVENDMRMAAYKLSVQLDSDPMLKEEFESGLLEQIVERREATKKPD